MTDNGRSYNEVGSVVKAEGASLDDPRVHQAMEEYLKLLQSGRRPDRDAFLARYPDVAHALAVCLQGLDFVHAAGAELSHPAAGGEQGAAGDALEPPESLGDFRIVREVGRGGMGVVYEAIQLSLGRRVALKVLPFAATMDPRHLQRFQNEARAAASLHHEHIVPVHAVGCERGVHFYAMQFIDGRTLAQHIEELRGEPTEAGKTAEASPLGAATALYTPGPLLPAVETGQKAATATEQSAPGGPYFRRVAEWGIEAAEALEYAHSIGVVHRDVKPANLMIDGAGKLWVTDFGLAQTAADSGLTMTGDLLGTLRYMSPEQALAKHGLVDHRTDVYSLGVTLYELLTLRPAVEGNDRQEILRRIAFEEPVPLRRWNRRIPAELETIVLKSMEKWPQDRYTTAQEFADDLRRFLNVEPIQARPPTLIQRLSKWGRRHRSFVAAVIVTLSLSLIMLAISNIVIWYKQEETKEALRKAQLHQKEVNLLASNFRGEWEARLLRAENNSQARLEGINDMISAVIESLPEEETELQETCKVVFEQALKVYRRVLPSKESMEDLRGLMPIEYRHKPALLQEEMWGYLCMGNLYALRNEFTQAENAYAMVTLAVNRWNNARKIHTWAQQGEDKVIRSKTIYTDAIRERPGVKKAYRRALAHLRKQSPETLNTIEDYRIEVLDLPEADWDSTLELENHLRKIKVVEHIVEDIPTLNYANHLEDLWDTCGEKLQKAGRLEEAKVACRRALQVVEKEIHYPIYEKDPHWAYRSFRPAAIRVQIGERLANLDAPADAESAFRASSLIYEQSVRENPSTVKVLMATEGFARCQKKLGRLFEKSNRPADAENAYRQGIDFCQRFPFADIPCSWDNIILYHSLGALLQKTGRREEAERTYRQGLTLLKEHDQKSNNWPEQVLFHCYDIFLPDIRLRPEIEPAFHVNLGVLLRDGGHLDDAIAEYEEANRLYNKWVEAFCNLAAALEQKGLSAQAEDSRRDSQKIDSKNPFRHSFPAEWTQTGVRLVELADERSRGIFRDTPQGTEIAKHFEQDLRRQRHKKPYAAASHFYHDASAVATRWSQKLSGWRKDPLLGEMAAHTCYHAACAAALAGCGHDKDADKLDVNDRARLRSQALDWLRADLKKYQQYFKQFGSDDGTVVDGSRQLQHWLTDDDLSGVRGADSLAKLPEAERQRWQQFWTEVADSLARRQGKAAPEQKSHPKEQKSPAKTNRE